MTSVDKPTLGHLITATLLSATLFVTQPAEAAPGDDCANGRSDCFVLTGLTIDGVSAYPLKDLAPLYADALAREISPDELVRIAQAVTDKYRRDGYFLSRATVPPQTGPAGQARLRVYEGYIDVVEVTGDAAPALEGLMSGLTGKRPLRLVDLERRLVLAADLPGIKPRSSIEPVIDDPARHRLVVSAGLQRWTGSLYVDNRGADAVGPGQANLRVGFNSWLRSGDQLAVSVFTIPHDYKEFLQAEVSYGAALASGARIRAAASASESRQGSNPFNNTVGNESQAASLRLAIPLQRARRRSLWAAVMLDGRHVEQAYRSGGGYADDVRVVRASLQADRSSGDASSSGYVQIAKGLPVLGASDRKGPRRSRFGADAKFWKVNAGATHYRDIGSRAGVFMSADGQWAPDPLLLSETFAPGALPYGRAYNYAEIFGDSGVAGLVEFRLGWDPQTRPFTFIQLYSFADAAKVWSRDVGFGSSSATLASAGAGLRLSVRDRATFRLELAKPLNRTPFDQRDRGVRVFGSLWAGF
ncbi:MAG: ShlB/FhaC/HecB family hemolysin secretion/activation protein [Phenylobacterium sp.]|nr:ShlB/FhaC/HecB family hemolysin secretion/activation protein [Phenylobacterium sp.]